MGRHGCGQSDGMGRVFPGSQAVKKIIKCVRQSLPVFLLNNTALQSRQ